MIVDELPPELVQSLINMGVDINNEEEVLLVLGLGLGIATLRKTKNGYTIMVLPAKRRLTPQRRLMYLLNKIVLKYAATGTYPSKEERGKIMKELYDKVLKEYREEIKKIKDEEKLKKIEERLRELLKSINNEYNIQ